MIPNSYYTSDDNMDYADYAKDTEITTSSCSHRGANKGPTQEEFIRQVRKRAKTIKRDRRKRNKLHLTR